jgi:hypothetical protein
MPVKAKLMGSVPSRRRKKSDLRPKREIKSTEMHSKHKLSKNEGSQAVALREALVKLQELELQSTENRAKVNVVQNRVHTFMYEFERTFTGKNAVSPEDYDMFQDEMRSQMESIVETIQENCKSNTSLLTSTSEGLVQASIAAAEAERAVPDEDGGVMKSGETVLDEIAEEMEDIFTSSQQIKTHLQSRLMETQTNLALAHDEEHAAKREVAKMQLQVANSKAEIRRVWNESQEKLKGLKELELKLHASKENIKRMTTTMKAREETSKKKLSSLKKEIDMVENSRNELREKLSQVDVIISNLEMERDSALSAGAQVKKEKEDLQKEVAQVKKEKEQMVRLQKEKNIKQEEKIIALKKAGEGHREKMVAMEKTFKDQLATAKHDANTLVKRKLEEAEEAHQLELKDIEVEHDKQKKQMRQEQEKKVQQFQEQLTQVQEEKAAMVEAASNKKENLEKLEAKIKEMDEEAEAQQATVATLTKEKEDLAHNNKTLLEEGEAVKQQHRDEMQAVQEETNTMKAGYETQLSELAKEVQEAQEQGAAGAAEQQAQEEKYKALEDKYAMLHSDKEEAQVQHEEDLKGLRETHLEELDTLKETMAQEEQDRLESMC